MRILTKYLSLLFAAGLPAGAVAMSFEGATPSHYDDYCRVLGIALDRTPAAAKEGLRQNLKQFNAQIDEVSDFYGRITSKPEFEAFGWGTYGHRILFHWGYARDPLRHEPLVRRLDALAWSPELRTEFVRALKEEQARRETEMPRLAGSAFGLYVRSDRRGFSAVLYNMHLLGDLVIHSENTTATADAVSAALRRAVWR